jgi:protein SCO1/2
MRRSVILIIVGVILGLAVAAGAALARPYAVRGSYIDPPILAQDFVLTDGQGADWRLADQRGSLVLMFFGYTLCPDICPATLGTLKQVRAQLGAQASDVLVVFVTVDPQRDTPDRIGKYVTAFDPTFVALSGSEEALEPVWKAYGVFRAISENASGAGYLVDHSTRTYLIDRGGNLRATYTFGAPLEDLVQDIRFFLKEKVQ